MALDLRRPPLALHMRLAQKVSLAVASTLVVSGVRPRAAMASSSVANLKQQLKAAQEALEAEKQQHNEALLAEKKRREAEKKRREAAEKRREAAETYAKLRIVAGMCLGLLMALFVCGIITGIVPRIVTRTLPPSVVDVIKDAVRR